MFDSVERAVGGPLEDVAASDRFVEVMAVGLKARRVAVGTAWRAVHGVTGTVLHAANIPTRDDVRRLNSHLTTLVTEVRALEQSQRAAIAPATPRRPGALRPDKGVPGSIERTGRAERGERAEHLRPSARSAIEPGSRDA